MLRYALRALQPSCAALLGPNVALNPGPAEHAAATDLNDERQFLMVEEACAPPKHPDRRVNIDEFVIALGRSRLGFHIHRGRSDDYLHPVSGIEVPQRGDYFSGGGQSVVSPLNLWEP